MLEFSILKGKAPILFAKPQLKALGAKIDFATDEMILPSGKKIHLPEASSGHYMLPICDFSEEGFAKSGSPKISTPEVTVFVTEK